MCLRYISWGCGRWTGRRASRRQIARARGPTSINAPNDILNIPDEIVAKLQTSEVLPAQETPAGLQLKQDAIFANRAGRVVEKEGRVCI